MIKVRVSAFLTYSVELLFYMSEHVIFVIVASFQVARCVPIDIYNGVEAKVERE